MGGGLHRRHPGLCRSCCARCVLLLRRSIVSRECARACVTIEREREREREKRERESRTLLKEGKERESRVLGRTRDFCTLSAATLAWKRGWSLYFSIAAWKMKREMPCVRNIACTFSCNNACRLHEGKRQKGNDSQEREREILYRVPRLERDKCEFETRRKMHLVEFRRRDSRALGLDDVQVRRESLRPFGYENTCTQRPPAAQYRSLVAKSPSNETRVNAPLAHCRRQPCTPRRSVHILHNTAQINTRTSSDRRTETRRGGVLSLSHTGAAAAAAAAAALSRGREKAASLFEIENCRSSQRTGAELPKKSENDTHPARCFCLFVAWHIFSTVNSSGMSRSTEPPTLM